MDHSHSLNAHIGTVCASFNAGDEQESDEGKDFSRLLSASNSKMYSSVFI